MGRGPAVIRAGLAGLAVIVLLGACGSAGPNRADQGRSIAESAGLPEDVGQFLALVLAGRTATFAVTYSTADRSGAPIQMTLTQQPPNRRVDVIRADGTVDTTLRTPSGAYQCTKDQQWSCGTLGASTSAGGGPSDPLSEVALSAAVERLRDRAKDYDFRPETRRLLGADARCLITSLRPGRAGDPALGASGTLCLSSLGAVLLVDTPSGKLTATDYRTTVARDAFELPAGVEQISTPASSAAFASPN